MGLLGLPVRQPRPPYEPLTPEELADLHAVLEGEFEPELSKRP